MCIRRLLLIVLAAGFSSSMIFGGLRGPGRYCGVVVFDRWDNCTLYSGIYVMYIDESVKASLREEAGQCVQIDARKVIQIRNPGDGVIYEFVKLGSAPRDKAGVKLDGLSLHAEPTFTDGERPSINISVRNTGEHEVTVRASELAPTLLGNPDGRGSGVSSSRPQEALITRHAFRVGPDYKPRTSGRGIMYGKSWAWTVDAAVPDSFV